MTVRYLEVTRCCCGFFRVSGGVATLLLPWSSNIGSTPKYEHIDRRALADLSVALHRHVARRGKLPIPIEVNARIIIY